MNSYQTVATVGDIAEGRGAAFAVNSKMVAVFLADGQYYAIDDFCPHMGASLAAGYLEDGLVTCPWHAWRFKVCDGTWCDNPEIGVNAYDVRVEGDQIQVNGPE